MAFFNRINGYKRFLLLLIGVLALTITFETSQQLFYLKRYNLVTDVTFFILLKNQAYRWLIWVLSAVFIFWYMYTKRSNENVSTLDMVKYAALILGLVFFNVIVISFSQLIINNEAFSVSVFFTEYVQFFMYQKAPMYILGYIAITIILHLYFINEQLQVKVQDLSELKLTNARLYNELNRKLDDRASVLNIKIGNKRKIIPVSDVVWIEADDYCVKVHTVDKNCYTMRSSLKALAQKLDVNFLRVHRKAIANMTMIKEVSMSGVPNLILNDDTQIPISKSHLKTVKDFISEH